MVLNSFRLKRGSAHPAVVRQPFLHSTLNNSAVSQNDAVFSVKDNEVEKQLSIKIIKSRRIFLKNCIAEKNLY